MIVSVTGRLWSLILSAVSRPLSVIHNAIGRLWSVIQPLPAYPLYYFSRSIKKRTFGHVRLTKMQISLRTVFMIRIFSAYINIGIKHGFSCINSRQVPWEVLKTEAEGRGFQHLPRDLSNVNALKNHVRSLLLHKN